MIGFPRNKPALFIPYLRRACAPPTTLARCRWSPRASRPCSQVSGTSRTRRCSEPNRQMMQRLSLQRPSPSPQRLRLSPAPTGAAPALTCATSHSARPAAPKLPRALHAQNQVQDMHSARQMPALEGEVQLQDLLAYLSLSAQQPQEPVQALQAIEDCAARGHTRPRPVGGPAGACVNRSGVR